jgi:nucleoside-diphosphate-sugar epimerase
MHILLGGTGHIGTALSDALVARGESVTVVTRNNRRTQELQRKGLQVALADVFDTDALRRVFWQGKRLFLLNPPADPSTDTDTQERRSLASILAALDGSGLEKVVAESTYGAQPVECSGDLGILWDMEQARHRSTHSRDHHQGRVLHEQLGCIAGNRPDRRCGSQLLSRGFQVADGGAARYPANWRPD